MKRIYRLKALKGNSYVDFEEPYEIFGVEPIQENNEDWLDVLSLYPFYSSIEVPETISQLVSDFCHTHTKSNIPKQKILSLIGGSQLAYVEKESRESDVEPIVSDFETERIELKKLLRLAKEYKFSPNNLNFQAVRFIGSANKTLGNFKNSWIIHRLMDGIIKELGENINTPEDFDIAAEKELSRTNSVKFYKRQQYIKGLSTRAFNHYLKLIVPNESQRYRDICIGVFLNCAQIPLTKENKPLLSPIFTENFADSLEDNIQKIRKRLEASLIK